MLIQNLPLLLLVSPLEQNSNMKKFVHFSFVFLVSCASNEPLDNQKFYTWVDEFGVAHVVSKEASSESKPKVSIDKSQNQHGMLDRKSEINERDYISSDVIDEKLNNKKHFSWMDNGKIIEEIVDLQDVQSSIEDGGLSKSGTVQSVSQNWVENLDFSKVLSFQEVSNREVNLTHLYTYDSISKTDYLIIEIPKHIELNKIEVRSLLKAHSIALPSVKFFDANLAQLPIPFIFSTEINETWASYAYLSGVVALNDNVAFMVIHSSKEFVAPIKAFDNAPVSDLGFLVIKGI